MAMAFSVEPRARLVVIRYESPYTLDEWRTALDDALADPRFEPGFDFLVDRSEVEAASIEFARGVAEYVTDHPQAFANCRIAIVVQPGVAFGMARMQEVLNETGGATSMAFTTEEDARRWIAARSGP